VQADGEVLPGATPLTCRVLPRAATFVVPARTAVPGVRLEPAIVREDKPAGGAGAKDA
jgi:hypothetical protein